MKIKDFYGSELHVGDKVAFHHNNVVRLGHIKSIKFKPSKQINLFTFRYLTIEVEITHLFNGGVSVVKNLNNIIKLKIDALQPGYK